MSEKQKTDELDRYQAKIMRTQVLMLKLILNVCLWVNC